MLYSIWQRFDLFESPERPKRAHIHFSIQIIAYPGLMSILIKTIVHFFLIYADTHWRTQGGLVVGGHCGRLPVLLQNS